jgi:hypothetical protein
VTGGLRLFLPRARGCGLSAAMNSDDGRPSLPPHSLSPNISYDGVAGVAPRAVVVDQVDGNEQKERTSGLVAEARGALQRVDEGCSPQELYAIVPALVDRVQQLVRCSLEEIELSVPWNLRLAWIIDLQLCVVCRQICWYNYKRDKQSWRLRYS